jgi:hypothetical protein
VCSLQELGQTRELAGFDLLLHPTTALWVYTFVATRHEAFDVPAEHSTVHYHMLVCTCSALGLRCTDPVTVKRFGQIGVMTALFKLVCKRR